MARGSPYTIMWSGLSASCDKYIFKCGFLMDSIIYFLNW
jgi:hypothetical protein